MMRVGYLCNSTQGVAFWLGLCNVSSAGLAGTAGTAALVVWATVGTPAWINVECLPGFLSAIPWCELPLQSWFTRPRCRPG
jgi:L-cystine uptake protein TcyP (sodium:dicarboxylate symporter family)